MSWPTLAELEARYAALERKAIRPGLTFEEREEHQRLEGNIIQRRNRLADQLEDARAKVARLERAIAGKSAA
jgi:hypothetical protein